MQGSFSWKTWLGCILGSLCFFILLNVFSLQVRSKVFHLTLPAQSFFWEKGIGFSSFLDGAIQGGKYRKENTVLVEQVEILQAKLAEFETFQRENEELKNALDIGLPQEFKLLGANVTGKDVSRDMVFIDKGTAEGVVRGMPVVTSSKVAVGEVIEAYEHSSKVRLLSDEGSSIEAAVLSKDAVGVVKGLGRSRAVLDLIPQDKDIQKGDMIVTSHLGSVFPQNLLVGQVQEVEGNDTGAFKRAQVLPLFNLGTDTVLFVIL